MQANIQICHDFSEINERHKGCLYVGKENFEWLVVKKGRKGGFYEKISCFEFSRDAWII